MPLGKIESTDELARKQFQAKTDFIVNLGSYEMCRGDQKDFLVTSCLPGKEGWKWKAGLAVLEVLK